VDGAGVEVDRLVQIVPNPQREVVGPVVIPSQEIGSGASHIAGCGGLPDQLAGR
jgi:hypothetical protein